MTADTENSRSIQLLGSVPLADAEEVMTAIATALGPRAPRMTDGETGARLNWIECQAPIFMDHPQLETVQADEDGAAADWRNKDAAEAWKIKPWQAPRAGIDPADITFGPLGYAAAAEQSYRLFRRLKENGTIARDCRLQVALPTPYNVIDQRIAPDYRVQIEAPYERRMLAEIDEMAAAIPPDELAIQWDTAHEMQNLAGARPQWFENHEQGIVERLVRLGDHVPAAIELGYHLCYGDFNHRHFIEPEDTGIMTRIANKLAAAISRDIGFLHMPVPRGRADDAYFAPLADLELRPETKLYLGLVHFTDGVEGAKLRIAAAERVLGDFGIATECGFGRRDPKTVGALLDLHREIADLA